VTTDGKASTWLRLIAPSAAEQLQTREKTMGITKCSCRFPNARPLQTWKIGSAWFVLFQSHRACSNDQWRQLQSQHRSFHLTFIPGGAVLRSRTGHERRHISCTSHVASADGKFLWAMCPCAPTATATEQVPRLLPPI